MNPEYLGDGVYAALNDHGQLVLTTGEHDLLRASNIIFLEPEVYRRLLDFGKRAGFGKGST